MTPVTISGVASGKRPASRKKVGESETPNSIFAAEVDDEEMWSQIAAAPLEPLTRRYSRHDVTEAPNEVSMFEHYTDAYNLRFLRPPAADVNKKCDRIGSGTSIGNGRRR